MITKEKLIASVNLVQLKTEVENDITIGSKFIQLEKYNHDSGICYLCFDDTFDAADDLVLDGLISAHVPSVEEDEPLIFNIVNSHVKTKEFHDINYKTELLTNKKLHPKFFLTDDGLLEKTEYYDGYQDDQNKGVLILLVEEVYVLNPAQSSLDKTAREVVSRTKKRKYANDSNDASKFHSKTKDSSKVYETRIKKEKEGKKRRENVVGKLTENVGLAGVLSGTFTSSEDANEKLTSLLSDHASALSVYNKTGRGTIQTDIQNDVSNTWLTNTVSDNASTQAMCPHMIGMKYKDYIKEKLKGNIK